MIKTLDNCKTDDIILGQNGDKCRVMDRVGELIYRSSWWLPDSFQEVISVSDAKKKGWKILQKHDAIPYTVKEAEEELSRYLGKFIKIIN